MKRFTAIGARGALPAESENEESSARGGMTE
jgi:hypothetical protein